jgi:hypothetical protein
MTALPALNALSARELRAARARLRLPVYKLAALVDLHPSRLALMLNERIVLPVPIAKRVATALQNMETSRPR